MLQGSDTADEHDYSTESLSTTDSLFVSFSRTRVVVTELSKMLNQPILDLKSKGNKLSARVLTSALHY